VAPADPSKEVQQVESGPGGIGGHHTSSDHCGLSGLEIHQSAQTSLMECDHNHIGGQIWLLVSKAFLILRPLGKMTRDNNNELKPAAEIFGGPGDSLASLAVSVIHIGHRACVQS
jgi:hypothetical protein